jgi:two-component system phosphate regulon sensor histidine kinase PhoR
MRPSSMSSRLWRGCFVFALLTISAGALVNAGVRYQNAAVSNEVKYIHPLEITSLEIRADFANSQAALGAYLLTRVPQLLVFYSTSTTLLQTALQQARLQAGPPLQSAVIAQQTQLATWLTFAARIQQLPPSDPLLIQLSVESYPSATAFDAANAQMLTQLQTASQAALNGAQQVLTRTEVWSGILAALAVLLALLGAFGTIRGITKPLRSLTSTLRRLSAGDHAARAVLAGSLEAREVAQSVNTLADETDRLRAAEEEHSRLSVMAREMGFRIREHLHADDVLRVARAVLEENLDTDVVYLHVMRAGKLGPPEGHADDWILPDTFLDNTSPDHFRMLSDLLRTQSSGVVQDISGLEGGGLPAETRDQLREAGVVSFLITPFGVSGELLGVIIAARRHAGHPWTDAEVQAVESIAADLGRGLHHARLYEEENRLVEELRSIDQAKSDFVATVSHELRTPLTSITGYTEMLLDRELGELSTEQEQTLERVGRNAVRLQDLIEDLLTISAIEAGTFTTVTRPINLLDIISGAAEDIAPAVAAKGLTLTTALAAGGMLVNGDANQLVRVLTNLLSNAVKFTPEGGRIELTTVTADGWAVVSVADTGIGIPEADKKNLFTRFFRASNATQRAIPGTGLGLSIIQTIIAGHGGELTLDSQEGNGTTVTVRLPLAHTPGSGEPAEQQTPRPSPPTDLHPAGLHPGPPADLHPLDPDPARVLGTRS